MLKGPTYAILAWVLVWTCLSYNSFTNVSKLVDKPLNYSVHTGYIQITMPASALESSIFYEYVSKQGQTPTNPDPNSPVVIWLEGGPGRSSQFTSWGSFGPFLIDGGVVKERPFEERWNTLAHLVFVDQPVSNVGLSFTKNNAYIVKTLEEAASQFTEFMEILFGKDSLRSLQKNPIYFAGTGYAGHYIPAFVARLKASTKIQLDIRGTMLVNPWINPSLHFKTHHSTLTSAGLVDYSNGFTSLLNSQTTTASDFLTRSSKSAQALLQRIVSTLPDNLSYDALNYRKVGGEAEYSVQWQKWINQNQEKYGVPVFVKLNPDNKGLYEEFLHELLIESSSAGIAKLLSQSPQMRIVLASGQWNGLVSAGSVNDCVIQMREWKDLAEWKSKSKKEPWKIDGKVVGNFRDYGNLAVAVAYKSGENLMAANKKVGMQILVNLITGGSNLEK